jgi:8-hydroxy-5-deazaflavin:NADPH oxidoreductase
MKVIPGGHVVTLEPLTVGVLGGTGPQGRGLGLRLGLAGHRIVLGSRSAERATAAAAEVSALRPEEALDVTGAGNESAADADIVLVTVPYEGHRELLLGLADVLAGRVVVDCVNPTSYAHRGPPVPVPDGSATEEAAKVLPGSRVVGAFHSVSAKRLLGTNASVSTDVLVCGDDADAKTLVCGLAGQVPGMRGIDAGPLYQARLLEDLTTVLYAINRRYKTHAGFKITGV